MITGFGWSVGHKMGKVGYKKLFGKNLDFVFKRVSVQKFKLRQSH